MKQILSAIMLMLSTSAFAQDTKPNILWIITDDQRADAIECFNRATRGTSQSALGYVSSPNIDKLAAEGVLFTKSYCNTPACAPSRGSMHTGRYPHHSGIYGFLLTHNTNDFAKPVVPQVMKNAGYSTATFGKTGYYIFEYNDPMRYNDANFYDQKVSMENDLERVGITDWCKKAIYTKGDAPGTKEFWYYPDGSVTSYYLSRKNAELTQEDIETAEAFRKKHKVIMSPVKNSTMILGGESPMPTDKTLDGRITEEFCAYLDNEGKDYKLLSGRKMSGADPSKPQFLHLGYHFPHTAVMPSKEFRDKFLKEDYKIPELTDDEYSKMPPQLQKLVEKGSIRELSKEDKLQIIRDYYAFCAMGDQLIGKAVDKFKAYSKKHNQPYIIVYVCGDHGWHLGEQGISAKFSNYIKSNETTVVVSSSDKKKFPNGKVVSDFVEFVDFAPTFFSAAGLDVNSKEFDYLDGYNLADVVSKKKEPREYVIGELSHVIGPRAYMRTKDFAFSMRCRKENKVPSAAYPPNTNIKWALECTPKQAEMALFDLRNDPNEVNNLAYTDEYKELANWFRKKLGNIVLGDNRIECDWKVKNSYNISSFAEGSDDKKINIPKSVYNDER